MAMLATLVQFLTQKGDGRYVESTQTPGLLPAFSRSRLPHTRNLDYHVNNRADNPQCDEHEADLPGHHPFVARYDNEQRDKCDEYSYSRDEKATGDVDVIDPVVHGLVWVVLVLTFSTLDGHVRSTQANTKEDVEHRSPKAGGSVVVVSILQKPRKIDGTG